MDNKSFIEGFNEGVSRLLHEILETIPKEKVKWKTIGVKSCKFTEEVAKLCAEKVKENLYNEKF